MTRHTRSKQLIKLAMMQGEDVRFAKWNYSPGLNVTISESCKRDTSIDQTFKWSRYKLSDKIKNVVYFASTLEMQLGEKKKTIPCVRYIDVNKGGGFC